MAYRFIKTGSTLLDLILGGGYALGRMAHIVGDPSTGKTQLAIEAAANFHRQYPQGFLRYMDAEYAFDENYAQKVGFPKNSTQIKKLEPTDPENGFTVEDLKAQILRLITELDSAKKQGAVPEDTPGCFIVDSLDGLPTEKELTLIEKFMGKAAKARKKTSEEEDDLEKAMKVGGYGTEKSKFLGEMFRTTTSRLERLDIHFMCISQTRDNVSGYGPKKIFSGGNSPKFYRSQALMLKHLEKLEKTINGTKYITGVKIGALCEKNKCAKPFQETTLDIIFDYGIDDLTGNLEWLKQNKKLILLPADIVMKPDGKPLESVGDIKNRIYKLQHQERLLIEETASLIVQQEWKAIQDEISESLPQGKYATVEQ